MAITAITMATSAQVFAKPNRADTLETFPLEKVRRGQTGYGMTTFQGTQPERFSFEVIGVNKNFLPKMDIILVKSDDPKLQVSGFWRGMSGSPLFIDDKLVCAFSYGFRFNKVAIGGCTPIHYMKREGFIPRRNLPEGIERGTMNKRNQPGSPVSRRHQVVPPQAASVSDWLRVAPERTLASAMEEMAPPRRPWLLGTPLPPAPARAVDDGSGLVASAVPLAMSGFSAPAFAAAKQVFGDYPLEPMRAGGTGNANSGPTRFQPGGAIGVQLIRGDMSAAATGTVSYVEGSRVLGFGHPLFQAGELYAPVAAAEVHTVIPSALNAFLIASPLREIGSLVQDRQSTIMADTGLRTRMIPVDITIETERNGRPERGEFHVEVIDNRFMTGAFTGIAAMSAISHFLPDRDRATVYMKSAVHIRGYEPIQFVDYLAAADGASGLIGGARGLRVLVPLLNNPFAPVIVDRVTLEARIHYDANFGNIEALRLPRAALPPGQRTHVDVVMSTFDGERIVERVPFDVPKELAGSIVQLEVTSGDMVRLDAAPPESLDSLVEMIRAFLPGNTFAVTIFSAGEGVAIDGHVIRDLPASALDRLNPSAGTKRTQTHRAMSRSVVPSKRVINGKKTLLIKVADE